MREVELKRIHELNFRPGEVIHLRADHSLVEEPLRLRIEKTVRDIVNDYIVATLLHRERDEEGPKVVLKRMVVSVTRGGEPDPLIPHLLPHITIATDESKGRAAGNNVVQLYVPGKPDPETLARDLAYLFAQSVRYHGSQVIHDVRPENLGKRPFDVGIFDPEFLEKLEKGGPYPSFFLRVFVASTVEKILDEKERQVFWKRFREHAERFLTDLEELERYETEERKKLVDLLRKLGYTPRKTLRIE